MTHVCVSKLTIIGSDNGLSPGRRQAIIWTNAVVLLMGSLGTNFSEILIEILIFSFKKTHLKISSAKWRPFCLGLNVIFFWPEVCYMRWGVMFVYGPGNGRQHLVYRVSPGVGFSQSPPFYALQESKIIYDLLLNERNVWFFFKLTNGI